MEMLLICGQDIGFLSIGRVQNGVLVAHQTVSASPEQYLSTVDLTMREWGIEPSELSAIAVVTGPGSFTSSRISTVIANTIAFAKQIPVIPIENPDHLPLDEIINQIDVKKSTPFAIPTYNRPPHITNSNYQPPTTNPQLLTTNS